MVAADDLCRFVLREVPAVGGGPGPEQRLRRSAEARILDILLHLARGTEPAHATAYAVAMAGDFARRGVELQDSLGGITFGHQFLSQALLETVENVLPPAEQLTACRAITDLLFRYHNIQLDEVASAYTAERTRWSTSTAAARRAIVLDLLAGRATDLSDAGRLLGYDLRRHHLAIVAWQVHGDDHNLAATVTRLAQTIGREPALIIPEDDATVWAWLGRQSPLTAAHLAAMRDLATAEGVRVAVGDRGRGIDGFRAGHHAAMRVRQVAELAAIERPVLDHGELGLVCLLTADGPAASWFVRRELGPLAAADPKTVDLRETVRCYLASGSSLVATARALRIARNTVVYRLKRAEELRGRPIRHRVAELHAALEILHVWGDKELSGSGDAPGAAPSTRQCPPAAGRPSRPIERGRPRRL